MTADPHTNPAALHAGTPAGADASPASAGIKYTPSWRGCTTCDGIGIMHAEDRAMLRPCPICWPLEATPTNHGELIRLAMKGR